MTRKKGFTIVELSLTLGFLSVLLLTIAYLTINVTSTYQKGLAIKAINTTGEDIIDDFSHAIASSPSKNIISNCGNNDDCKKDGALLYAHVQYNDNYDLHTFGSDATSNGQVPMHGVFCTGRYSYIYTTGYAINKGIDVTFRYNNIANTPQEIHNPRLLKVADQSRKLCSDRVNHDSYSLKDASTYGAQLTVYDMGSTTRVAPTDLLDSNDYNLAIYDLQIFSPVMHKITQQSFYSGTFILATTSGEVNILSAGDYCTETPDNLITDFNYCAINKFNFAMRATGELNKEETRNEQHQ